MGGYPWFRRRRFFLRKGPQGRFVAGLAVIVTAGLFLNIISAYFLIDRRLEARLYKIHLQANSTLDIIWPVIWKLSLVSAFLVTLSAVALGYYLIRRLDMALDSYLGAMKSVGRDGDLTVRVRVSANDMPAMGSAFEKAMGLLDERLGRVRAVAYRIETSMDELKRRAGVSEEPLKREELIGQLNQMMSRSDEALTDISIFRV